MGLLGELRGGRGDSWARKRDQGRKQLQHQSAILDQGASPDQPTPKLLGLTDNFEEPGGGRRCKVAVNTKA